MPPNISFANNPRAMPNMQQMQFQQAHAELQAQQMMMRKAISGKAHQIHPPPPHADHDQLYYFDDAGSRDTPPRDPNRHRPRHQTRNRPSIADAVLVHFMDGGRWPDIASRNLVNLLD
jgi:hypothetical protein